MKSGLKEKDIRAVKFQMIADHLFFPFTGYAVLFIVYILRRWKFPYLKETRKICKELYRDERPIMICSNHLTFVDSVIIMIATSSVFGFIKSFRTMSWNIPAVEHYRGSLFLKTFSWLGKCIPIDREGSQEHISIILEKMKWLLSHRNIVTIFPEGRRSRTGRVDREGATYGVGNILKDLENPRVLCVYLRGDHQENYSKFPVKGESFYLKMKVIEPVSKNTGLRAARDISMQIIDQIVTMEEEYFSSYTGRKF